MSVLTPVIGTAAGIVNFTRSNPDYASILAAAAQETDPVAKQALIDQIEFVSPLRRDEIELFEYCNFDYIENNPGYVEGGVNSSYLYVLPNYMVDGYINIENITGDVGLYVEAGYVDADYISVSASSNTGFIAYVGEYYNQNGETT